MIHLTNNIINNYYVYTANRILQTTFMRKNYLLLTLVLIVSISLNAQRLKTEDFNYQLGQLTNLNAGANVSNNSWISLSGNVKPLQVIEGDLTYPNYYTSSSGAGSHLHLDSSVFNAEDAYSAFDTVKENTLYVSFLLNVISLNNLAPYDSANADYIAALYSSNPTGQPFCRLYIKQGNIAKKGQEAASFNLGISIRGYATTPIQWDDEDLLPNSVHLITIGYQIVPGENNDVAKLWINQPFSASEPSPKALSTMNTAAGTDPGNIYRFALRQGYNASLNAGTPVCEIDAIKISSSWLDGTLPLQLLNFTISNNNGYPKLSWQTCNEINVKQFEIQKSSDAQSFSTISIINAKNGACSNTYSFSETKFLSGNTYYRIKMVESNGKATYSSIVSINNNLSVSMSAFPNPATNNLSLTHPRAGSNAYIQVISISGRDILRQALSTGTNQTNVDVSTFSKGYYIVVFVDGNNRQSIQFVKQ